MRNPGLHFLLWCFIVMELMTVLCFMCAHECAPEPTPRWAYPLLPARALGCWLGEIP